MIAFKQNDTAVDLEKLKAPFPANDIEWRVQRSGMAHGKPWAMVLAYVDARAVQDRLDAVCGASGWTVEYEHLQGGVMCRLGVMVNGAWIFKSDGAPETQIESFKGGISKALVRTASVWGVGRYLYNLKEGWATFVDRKTPGARPVKIDGNELFWVPPELPSWALPSTTRQTKDSAEAPVHAHITPPQHIEEPPPHGDEQSPNSLGDTIIRSGKHQGKRLRDVKQTEARGYFDALRKYAANGKLGGYMAELEGQFEAYYAEQAFKSEDKTDRISF